MPDVLQQLIQSSEAALDICDISLTLIGEKAMLRRSVASLERNNDTLVATIADLRHGLRDQDAEIQALRAENARLTTLLQIAEEL